MSKIKFFKGIEKNPKLFGIDVNFLIPFFLFLVFQAIVSVLLFSFLGVFIGVVFLVILLLVDKVVYTRLRKKANNVIKPVRSENKRVIYNNLYSKNILND